MRFPQHFLPPLLLLFVPTFVSALGQKSIVTFNSTSTSDFALVSFGEATSILVSKNDFPGVRRAVNTWAGDIGNVTTHTPQVLNELTEAFNSSGSLAVVVGSVGSTYISTLVAAGAMNVSDIQGWEQFKIQIVDGSSIGVEKALVIAGSDKRGTIYGLYDLSEQIGVSPWVFWADAPVQHHDSIYIKGNDVYVHASPTVRYRGFFLNDEQPSLTNWAVERYGTNTSAPFQHEFYEEIFSLLLRLKANFFWPAMWAAKFAVDDPLNQFLADDYGVIYSTSHQEPMSRNTPEWSAYGNGIWNYTTNKAFLDKFWTYGVERAKEFETIYTVGMRGDGDIPLPGANIAIIQSIIEDQRTIISNVTQKNASETPQILCLYKEVQGYWDVPAGTVPLEVDEDVTLLWSDDNFGNLRRVPTAEELERSGGAGIYYHFDYVGDPRNYKWLATISIARVWEQLSLALEFGAKRLFVLNVGDLKPLEAPINFYFEYAYDATRWDKSNLDEYLLLWATREYGQEAAAKTANVYSRYMHFVSRQKPELTSPTTYSLISFREADSVVFGWNELIADAWSIYNGLAEEYKDSFFQTILHPVRAVGTVVILNISAGQNNLRAVQARMSTNSKAAEVLELFGEDHKLTVEYHTVNSGKWNHMMDQPHLGQWGWQQNMINTCPPLSYLQSTESTLPGPLRVSVQGSLGVWPGDALNQCAQGYNCPPPVLPLLTPYSEDSRWFEISQGAAGTVDWTWYASPNVSWVKLSKTEGQVSGSNASTWEERIEVSVSDWSAVPAGLHTVQLQINTTTVTNDLLVAPGSPMTFTFSIPVQNLALPANVTGVYVESDGGVSIEAAHASRNTTVNGTTWEVIPGYSSRTSDGAAVSMFPRVGANFSVGAGPKLEYDFFTFNNQTRGNVTVNLFLGTTLNFQVGRPLRYAVQIDDLAPQVVQPVPAAPNAGANPSDWNAVVAANSRISSTNHTLPAPGKHTLSVWGIEQGVVLEKIVINTVAPSLVQTSYLGQPESKRG